MTNFQIIDAHVHPFTRPGNCTSIYGHPATPQEMVQTLKDAGISGCCGSVLIKEIDGNTLEGMRRANDEALEFAAMFPGFGEAGVTVNARYPEESCQEIERLHKAGARWVGEIVSYMSGNMAFASEGFFPAYDLAQQYGMPVNIHQDNMADIEPIVRNFPKLNVVMAHPDEKRTYLQRLALMKQYKNLYLDLSGTGLFRWGMLRYGVDEAGADRFLFGSDFPICSPAMNVGAIEAERITDEQKQMIFAGNFLRLTGRA